MMENFSYLMMEILLLVILGVLYYFYQKRKITQYEEQKTPHLIGLILQSLLTDRESNPSQESDELIAALDRYLHGETLSPPLAQLSTFADSHNCSGDLRQVILEGLKEIETT